MKRSHQKNQIFRMNSVDGFFSSSVHSFMLFLLFQWKLSFSLIWPFLIQIMCLILTNALLSRFVDVCVCVVIGVFFLSHFIISIQYEMCNFLCPSNALENNIHILYKKSRNK